MKWEHNVSLLSAWPHLIDLEGYLNLMGKGGWQLVAVDNGIIYLQRFIETGDNFDEAIKEAAGRFMDNIND